MTARCIGTPVSWLRLEQYLLDELPYRTRREVEQHLNACSVCRSCLQLTGGDVASLAAFPAARSAAPRLRRPLAVLLSAAALIGAVLLMYRAPTRESGEGAIPPARIAIKGGELAIELVRDRAGVQTRDPARFRREDRFRVRVTCPPGSAVRSDVMVVQRGEVAFPLPVAPLACGNAVALPGAFVLTSSAPATVCLLLDPPERSRLRELRPATLPGLHVCRQLTPE